MGKHKNQIQEATFLKFMEEHMDLANNCIRGDRAAVEALWSQLVRKLNRQGPPQKDCNAWKKVWLDWKRCIRKKIAHNKFPYRAIGGGPYRSYGLSSTEKAIAQLCGIYSSVAVIPKSVSFGINDNNDEAISSDNDSAETSTASHSSTRKRQRDDYVHDSVKKHMDSEASAGESISEIMKQRLKNSEDNTKTLTENNSDLPEVYKFLEKLNDLILHQNTLMAQQNEDRRNHYLAMQQIALEKNEIERKMLEIEEMKFKKEYGEYKKLY